MTIRKTRLTVTIDVTLLEAGKHAVKAGWADSLSAWVNEALADRAGRERRRKALRKAIASYEKEFGVITEAEMEEQARLNHQNAVVVRGKRSRRRVA